MRIDEAQRLSSDALDEPCTLHSGRRPTCPHLLPRGNPKGGQTARCGLTVLWVTCSSQGHRSDPQDVGF
ncbi:hypothetical protein E2C01_001622 [Portunus trituberculatus]|uniref:Uncharacterized protein n=1 Tax=Portunus trituberculatus TaxID=210409 RepID=A0A5B7CI37_PORTR|nr:hypothetical protein [Portunus trituberculatus]